jgi:hypothetical protein
MKTGIRFTAGLRRIYFSLSQVYSYILLADMSIFVSTMKKGIFIMRHRAICTFVI